MWDEHVLFFCSLPTCQFKYNNQNLHCHHPFSPHIFFDKGRPDFALTQLRHRRFLTASLTCLPADLKVN